MANAMRVLFISGEVAPFTKDSEIAALARQLPEFVHETGQFETRIMMPRYGIISERRNRLHEVIRLSGREIPMGEASHTLKVKVASIPGIRLQVYFMDSVQYFKRKGIVADREGKVFEDNGERALFFGRSALETIRNLGWRPDVVHAFGWISGMVPWLLKTQFANEDLFDGTKCVYTPDSLDARADLTEHLVSLMGVEAPDEFIGLSTRGVGSRHADLVAVPASVEPSSAEQVQFAAEIEACGPQAQELYEQVASNVTV